MDQTVLLIGGGVGLFLLFLLIVAVACLWETSNESRELAMKEKLVAATLGKRRGREKGSKQPSCPKDERDDERRERRESERGRDEEKSERKEAKREIDDSIVIRGLLRDMDRRRDD